MDFYYQDFDVAFRKTSDEIGVDKTTFEVNDNITFDMTSSSPETASSNFDRIEIVSVSNDNDCRANQEQNDPNARPEIENVINIEAYETIFLGYTIWWGKLPKIIYTFMGSYSFDKKMIIPFCTSGSSGISYIENELHQLAPVADFKEGRRFSSSVDTDELYSWIESLNL